MPSETGARPALKSGGTPYQVFIGSRRSLHQLLASLELCFAPQARSSCGEGERQDELHRALEQSPQTESVSVSSAGIILLEEMGEP